MDIEHSKAPRTFVVSIAPEAADVQDIGVQTGSDNCSPHSVTRDPAFFYVDHDFPPSSSAPVSIRSDDDEKPHSNNEVDSKAVSVISEDSILTGHLLVSEVNEFSRGSITSRIIEDLFRERRRQLKLQSLEDIIILLAIPRYKCNGTTNHMWPSCYVVTPGDEPRSIMKQLEDPTSGDIIYSFSRRPLVSDTSSSVLRFALQCGCCDDRDQPYNDEYYSVPLNHANIYSLRDGSLVSGDKIFDIGIIICLECGAMNEVYNRQFLLHYFDELCGRWVIKSFACTRQSKYVCVLPGARRAEFVIEEQGKFLKTETGGNFRIYWPGCYMVKDGLVSQMEYVDLMKDYIDQIKPYTCEESPANVKEKTPPKPVSFAIYTPGTALSQA